MGLARRSAARQALSVVAVLGNAALAPSVAADDVEPAVLPTVVVTGSRIPQASDASSPVTTIDRATIVESGYTSLGAFLQSLPFMAGAPVNTGVGARDSGGGFSRGVESTELRGMGASRTLVLVNGRRFVPGGNGVGGVIDLAMIPLAAVERIEILKTGASVEYGADAVAGVVNIITRSSSDGIELRAAAGRTDRGDGERYDLHVVAGHRLGRLQMLGGVGWFDQSAVGKGERGYSRELLTVTGPGNTIVSDGSSSPPGGNHRTSNGRVTLIDGEDGDAPADFRPFIGDGPGNDRFNFNPYEDLVQQSQRLSLFANARFDASPAIGLFGEALLQQRDSSTGLAPLPFFSNRLDDVVVSADSAYNPFDEDIGDSRRRLIEAGGRAFEQDNTAWRVAIGVDGAVHDWYWDVSFAHGRNEIDQRQEGDLLADRVRLALGPSFVDGNGNAVCGTPDAVIPGCIPLNLFGPVGSITPDMLAYVGASDLVDHTEATQTVWNANLAGSLLRLPAGNLRAAFGAEVRIEQAEDTPDPQTQAGNTTGAARAPTRGRFDARELYAEAGVPLVAGGDGAALLELEAGARFVDYSNFDTESVYDAGLHLRPLQGLTIRASYAEAFRAPTVGELFGGLTQSNPAVDDPCADFDRLGQTEIDRCVAQGVPADGSFDQSGNETPLLGGGNPNLEPEQADVFSIGISYAPAQIADLVVSVDYYDIDVDGAISSLGANTILEQCLATGSDAYCSRIERDANGNITRIFSELRNISGETAAGLDLAARYRHAVADGSLSHDLLLSRVLERDLVAVPGAKAFVGAGSYDPDQFGAIPLWKGQYRLRWDRHPVTVAYNLQWIGAFDERGGELYPGTVNHVDDVFYHDIGVAWQAVDALRLEARVDNLLDEQPPFVVNGDAANTDVHTYRLLGRTWGLSLQYRF